MTSLHVSAKLSFDVNQALNEVIDLNEHKKQ